jgi:N utilization substance protein B
MNRSVARERALQSLYQIEISKLTAEEAIANVTEGENSEYIFKLVKGVETHLAEIDDHIRPLLKGWTIERLSYIDRAILRLGVFELLYEEEVPDPVAIDEAVELAKKYGDDKSSKFINGVLSNLMKDKAKQ